MRFLKSYGRFFGLIALLMCMVSAAFADNYPSKMYIKGAWEGRDGSWTWHTMTTVADGIYTYNAVWNDLYGCNINTSKSDTNSAWFKYNTIVGYDESLQGQNVVLTYVASCERLYVALRDASSVVLMLSTPEYYVGREVKLSSWCRNLSGARLDYYVTNPDGVESYLGQETAYFTPDKTGKYTFRVDATPAPGNISQQPASCSLVCDFTEYMGPEPCPFTPTSDEKKRAFHEDPATHDITFIFDPATWSRSYDNITSVHVSGSFNGWSAAGDDAFKLRQDPDRKILYLTVPYNIVKRPGNIGQPEFKFVVNGNYVDPYSNYPADYLYKSNSNKNMIVVFSFDDLQTIRNTIAEAAVIKKVSDFDLTTRAGREEISNYRLVPGTTRLNRCYHPYKTTSRTDMSTEPYRMRYVNELAQADGVAADICLSEDETGNLGSYTANGTTYQETIPDYYREMLDAGHVLHVGKGYKTPSYNEVYYNNRGQYFGRWVKEIVDFINDDNNAGPFTIHCRLGTDRTGMFCATLAALCDAEWEDIVADYQKSNRMGVNEYRSYKLLKYAFELMLDVSDISEVPMFADAVKSYMVESGTLSTDDISKLKLKLTGNGDTSSVESLPVVEESDSSEALDADRTLYDLTGRRVTNPTPGIYIQAHKKITIK